jgi:hypothetical protein
MYKRLKRDEKRNMGMDFQLEKLQWILRTAFHEKDFFDKNGVVRIDMKFMLLIRRVERL